MPTPRSPSSGSPRDGGWSFAADPDHSARAAPALWRPHACTSVAIAAPSPPGFAGVSLAELVSSTRVAAELLAHRDWYFVLRVGERHLRLWVRGCEANEPLAYLSPADSGASARLAAAAALHAALAGSGPGSAGPGMPGPSERWRLAQWLRLLDAREAGARAREIAAALIRDDAQRFSAAEWDSSSERRRLARWQQGAIAMRDGGYRRLLAAG